MNSIAERILLVRGKTSQKDFAEKLKINANTLRSYEHGRSLPNNVFLEKICTLFSISPSWLLLGTGTMKDKERYIEENNPTIDVEGNITLERMLFIVKGLEEKLAEAKEAERAALIEAKEAYKLALQSSQLNNAKTEKHTHSVEKESSTETAS